MRNPSNKVIKIIKHLDSFEGIEVNDDPAQYGSKGESWADPFVKYMKSIVTHPIYSGMPDAVNEDGKIQWEAPSNRSGGKYQHTHQKRRNWWEKKAEEIGVDIKTDKWISRTAKFIHPTGEKPCKRCGLVLRIAYCYANASLILRIKKLFGSDFPISPLEPIDEIVQRALDLYGTNVINQFSILLSTPTIKVPKFDADSDAFLTWIAEVYIPLEPSLLSPGAMSNAPDRFDGFHSFNRCCRGHADSGRSASNLKSYSTDRRVFEFWSEGNWIAADRLMGLIRTLFINEPNADGGDGPPTADHIGPLSLGFCHRPEFRLLSKSANSAKNNRMTMQDIRDLLQAESSGINVVSWFASYLWDIKKNQITSEEKALRLSKMLRDNHRNAMTMLSYLVDKKVYTFLIYLLELRYADLKVDFINLRIENYITVFDSIEFQQRVTKYAIEQKARRLRIGFESLRSYRAKENRHLLLIDEDSMRATVDEVILLLQKEGEEFQNLNDEIERILLPEQGAIAESDLRSLIAKLPISTVPVFEKAKLILGLRMRDIGHTIAEMWENDRYVRATFDLE